MYSVKWKYCTSSNNSCRNQFSFTIHISSSRQPNTLYQQYFMQLQYFTYIVKHQVAYVYFQATSALLIGLIFFTSKVLPVVDKEKII